MAHGGPDPYDVADSRGVCRHHPRHRIFHDDAVSRFESDLACRREVHIRRGLPQVHTVVVNDPADLVPPVDVKVLDRTFVKFSACSSAHQASLATPIEAS